MQQDVNAFQSDIYAKTDLREYRRSVSFPFYIQPMLFSRNVNIKIVGRQKIVV